MSRGGTGKRGKETIKPQRREDGFHRGGHGGTRRQIRQETSASSAEPLSRADARRGNSKKAEMGKRETVKACRMKMAAIVSKDVLTL